MENLNKWLFGCKDNLSELKMAKLEKVDLAIVIAERQFIMDFCSTAMEEFIAASWKKGCKKRRTAGSAK